MHGIVMTLDKDRFITEFNAVRPHHFSRVGLELIFEYLEDYAWETHGNVEFDPIGICVDFEEDSIDDFKLHVSNLKHINEEDYITLDDLIDAAKEAGVDVIGYNETADTVVTLADSWV